MEINNQTSFRLVKSQPMEETQSLYPEDSIANVEDDRSNANPPVPIPSSRYTDFMSSITSGFTSIFGGLTSPVERRSRKLSLGANENTKHIRSLSIGEKDQILKLPQNPIAPLAAAKGDYRKRLGGLSHWLLSHKDHLISEGIGRNPVFFLGSDPYIHLGELEISIMRHLKEQRKAHAIKKRSHEKAITILKPVFSKFQENGYLLKYDLIKLFEYLRHDHHDENCNNDNKLSVRTLRKVLEKLISSDMLYFHKKDIFSLIQEYLKNSDCEFDSLVTLVKDMHEYIPIPNILEAFKDIKTTCSWVINQAVQELIGKTRQFQDVEDEKQIAFKTEQEGLLERRPNYIASLLSFESIMVEGNAKALVDFEGLSKQKHHLESPLGNTQLFINGGILAADINKLKEVDPKKYAEFESSTSVQSYQDAVLFSLITKQNDLHDKNAFLVKKPHGIFEYKLFDVGRCMTPDGVSYIKRLYQKPSRKSSELGTFIYLRCFLFCSEKMVALLTAESFNKIKSWDIEAIKKRFIIDTERSKKIEQLRNEIAISASALKAIKTQENSLIEISNQHLMKKEQELVKVLTCHIEPEVFEPFIRRLEALQQLIVDSEINKSSIPTLSQCAWITNALEMKIIELYETVYGKDKGAQVATTIEDALAEGQKKKLLTDEEVNYWKSYLVELMETKQLPVITWQYPQNLF